MHDKFVDEALVQTTGAVVGVVKGKVAVAARSTAKSRRRRMAKRQFEKRFKRIVGLVGALYALAVVLSPDRVAKAEAPIERMVALPAPRQWKPAASILQRKPGEFTKSGARPWLPQVAQVTPQASLTRWHRVYLFANKYKVSADLAAKIHDVAIQQSIEPDLGFRLVKAESEFKSKAVSSVGAIGLTQLMLGTAQDIEPNITRESLLDPETNLRIGFKYLRALIRENKGNLSLALLVYNRGPVAVQLALNHGRDPGNGYDVAVTRGYRGRGTLD
ncbi:MAG: lytic transglycosylase domain-containing protein [Gemmatimonadaceae bacterium]